MIANRCVAEIYLSFNTVFKFNHNQAVYDSVDGEIVFTTFKIFLVFELIVNKVPKCFVDEA